LLISALYTYTDVWTNIEKFGFFSAGKKMYYGLQKQITFKKY